VVFKIHGCQLGRTDQITTVKVSAKRNMNNNQQSTINNQQRLLKSAANSTATGGGEMLIFDWFAKPSVGGRTRKNSPLRSGIYPNYYHAFCFLSSILCAIDSDSVNKILRNIQSVQILATAFSKI
jgi:hypothetical protein